MAKQNDKTVAASAEGVVRVPVTEDYVKQRIASVQAVKAGMVTPGVTVGAVDSNRAVQARFLEKNATATAAYFGSNGGRGRTGGMMMDALPSFTSPYGTNSLPAYRTSYASGAQSQGGARDIPPYFVMMNEQNGGILYWPVTLREKYDWYRYFARCIYLSDNDLGQILMADGTIKSVDDVQIGDEVITGFGTIRKVKNKFERRCIEDKAVTIKAWCLQNHLKTTHHHPYWIIRRDVVKDGNGYRDNIDFNPEWINADRVNVGDYVLMAPVASDPDNTMTSGEARFLGYYAAEGSIVWGKRCVGTDVDGKGYKWHQEKIKVPVGVAFTINASEKDTLGKGILRTAKEVFGIDGCIVHERGNSVEIVVNGREVGEFCFYHVGTGSATKKLSSELLMSSKEARREFLVGYMEGDGCQYDEKTTNKGKIVIGTSSPMLASQVQVMAIGAGIMCRIAKYERSKTCKTGYKSDTDQWHITIPSWSADSFIASSDKWDAIDGIKQKRGAFFINGYAAFKVKEVTYSEEDDVVYNIEVDADGDEKSYICNGMVTHNTDAYCGRALELLTDLPMSKLTLNMPKMEKQSKKKKQEIHEFFTYMCDELNLFEKLHQILWEFNVIGNCFKPDALVHVPGGMMPIDKVRVRDKVLNANGGYDKVSRVMRRWVDEYLVEIKIDRLTGIDWQATKEHPVLALRDGVEQFVDAKNICKGDYVGIAFNDNVEDMIEYEIVNDVISLMSGMFDQLLVDRSEDSLTLSGKMTRLLSISTSEDFLYVLGYWLGDGWLWSTKNNGPWGFLAWDVVFDKNSITIDKIRDATRSVFGSQLKENEGGYCNDNLLHLTVKDPIFCEWWNHHFGKDSQSKKIPAWVELLPKDKLIWLLRGMIDSDGCINKEKKKGIVSASITTTNEKLMHQVFQIGIKCGIPFSFKKNDGRMVEIANHRQSMGRDSFTVYISDAEKTSSLIRGCAKELPISIGKPTVNQNYKEIDGRFYYRIGGVSEVPYHGWVYNLEVDGDHTYCTAQVRHHNCYIFHEWDEKSKKWDRIVILPPEEVAVFQYPFSDIARVEYKPERLMQLLESSEDMQTSEMDDLSREIVLNTPDEIKKMVRKNGAIIMDTDPTSGSFVHHMARMRSPYMDLGVSVLERVLIPMLMKEHYRYTQLSLASRNMTPKNKIQAPMLTGDQLEDLRTQIDLSYLDPEYSIVTNYEWDWEQIGADARLLDLSREYEVIESQVFAGLGVTRELLTGEGSYSGNRITVEILNTMFLIVREVLQEYVEHKLFKPVAEAHGWYEEGKNGVKKYWYPRLGFNRLTIRDNQEVFDSLFQLYQKGSLPVDIIYELFNLDPDSIHEKIYEDLFTVKDPTFNRAVENINDDTGRALVERSDVVDRVGKYLGLKVKPPEGEEDGGFGDFGGGFGDEEGGDGGLEAEAEELASTISEELPADSSDEEIEEVVDSVLEE